AARSGKTNTDTNSTANPKTNPNLTFFIVPSFYFIPDLASYHPELSTPISTTSFATLLGCLFCPGWNGKAEHQ
ncbi:MAG: hypothetical protein JSW12_10435, partial [Deltaproteobacteria bacterium]